MSTGEPTRRTQGGHNVLGNRINDRFVKALQAPEKGNKVFWDDEITGFGVRITAKGAKSFVLRYVFHAPHEVRRTSEYRYTIGSYPDWPVAAARDEAKEWKQRIARGDTHPLAAKGARRRAAHELREAETYSEAIDDYIRREQEGRRRNTTAREVRRSLLPTLTK